jgi:hypothetical protein
MIVKKIADNPYFLFFPFLIILIAIVLIFPTNGTYGDEGRYLFFAKNILHGFYSPPAPAINLDYSPGYPLLMVPFIALGMPLYYIALLNAFFYYFSMVLMYKMLSLYVSKNLTIVISLFWACYINAYQYVPILHNETLTIFLISLIAFNLVRAFNQDYKSHSKKYLLLSGFIIGYLALTKPIFGYVILVMLAGSGLIWLVNKKSENYKKAVIILLFGFALNVPYLIYTYNLTGKIFYWCTTGGNNLYWMSTPYENEYGNFYGFHTFEFDSLEASFLIPGGEEAYKSNHKKNMEVIFKLEGVERDDAYKKFAIENIKSHPIKFVQNCICNVGRIILDYPYSYRSQKPVFLIRFPFNGIIVVMMLFCLIPTLLNWRRVPFSIRFLLFFALVYFGGSVLGSAETRSKVEVLALMIKA